MWFYLSNLGSHGCKSLSQKESGKQNIMDLTVLLKELRTLTRSQSGYIFGETLRRIDKADEYGYQLLVLTQRLTTMAEQRRTNQNQTAVWL